MGLGSATLGRLMLAAGSALLIGGGILGLGGHGGSAAALMAVGVIFVAIGAGKANRS